MHHHVPTAVAIALAAMLSTTGHGQGEVTPSYTLYEIPVPEGFTFQMGGLHAVGRVNNQQQATLNVLDSKGVVVPFVYNHAQGTLDQLSSVPGFAGGSIGYTIHENGDVAGLAYALGGPLGITTTAARWSNLTHTTYPQDGAPTTAGIATTGSDKTYGNATDPNFPPLAQWAGYWADETSAFVQLPVSNIPSLLGSAVSDVGSNGTLIGSQSEAIAVGNKQHPTTWVDDALVVLPIPAGYNLGAAPTAANGQGEFAGNAFRSSDQGGGSFGVFWDDQGPQIVPNASRFLGISDDGVMVGITLSSQLAIWTSPTHNGAPLNTVIDNANGDWTVVQVFDMNDNGDIYAVAQNMDGVRPVLLTINQPSECAADIEGDNSVVDVSDLLQLLSNWGTSSAGAAIAAPTDAVDVFDLLGLLGSWGPCE